MTTYETSRAQRPGHRWAPWAALLLGLLFLALGAPLAMQSTDAEGIRAERTIQPRANG